MTPHDSRPAACLSPTYLAALAAGTLPTDRRDAAVAHLATCPDCYDVLLDLLAMREDPSLQTLPVTRPLVGVAPLHQRGRWTARAYVIAGLSAAALIAASVWFGPGLLARLAGSDRQLSGAVAQLAQAVGADRPTEARLTGGFRWGPTPGISRGTAHVELTLPVQDAVLAIKKIAADHRTARALDAVALAQLVEGDPDASVVELTEAVSLDPGDVMVRNDLAAARLERWRHSRTAGDAAAALDAAEQAMLRAPSDPIARFNHALAVEAVGLVPSAIDNWKAYLQLDASSPWAIEARQHLARLEGGKRSSADLALSEKTTDVQLAQVAASTPSALEHYLSTEWMGTWRHSEASWPDSSAAALGPRAARALIAAGRDHYLPDVILAAASSTRWTVARRDCLMQAATHLDASRAAYSASHTAEAESLGRQAAAGFLCAGLPTIEADAQVAWTVYFQQRTPEHLDAIERAAESAGYWRSVGRVDTSEVWPPYQSGHLSDADAGYERSIAAYDRAGDAESASTAWTMRAEVALDWGDDAGVWARNEKAFATFDLLTIRRKHIALVDASIAAASLGLPGAARFFADALVEADQGGDDPALLVGAYLQSANARFVLGDGAAALSALDAATNVFPKITDAALRTQFGAEIDALTGTIVSAKDPARAITAYTEAIKVFMDTGRPLRRARLLLDRGRAYRAAGNVRAAEQDWSDGATAFEDQRPSIRDAQLRIDHLDKLWDLFRELIAIRATDGLASLEVAERFRGRALLDALSSPTQLKPLEGASLYGWLPEHVTALAYAVLPDRVLRWTITRSGVTVSQQVIASSQLSTMVDQYIDRIMRPRLATGTILAGGDELSKLLLPEGLLSGGTERVVFLPDGPLFRLPFSMLVVPGTSRALIESVVPSVAPSLTILKATGATRRDHPLRALLVAAGDAHPREHLSALPGVDDEVRTLRPLYQAADVLEGAGVTAPKMIAAMTHADIVHFAGHAIADPVSLGRSRLLLSDAATPSALTFDDLRRVTLRPGAIVVLSTCEAARGPIFHGEGVVSLAYPFLANGASSVIAALWKIDDSSSVSLWRQFHARLIAGDAPDVALAATQRVGLREGLNPAVWAAFEAIGGLVRQ